MTITGRVPASRGSPCRKLLLLIGDGWFYHYSSVAVFKYSKERCQSFCRWTAATSKIRYLEGLIMCDVQKTHGTNISISSKTTQTFNIHSHHTFTIYTSGNFLGPPKTIRPFISTFLSTNLSIYCSIMIFLSFLR